MEDNTIKVAHDGSLYFPPKFPLPVLKNYSQDPLDPNHFIPKFDKPCTARFFIGKIKPCSKKFAFLWWCEKFQRSTSIATCEQCNEPDQSQTWTTNPTIEHGQILTLQSHQF